MKILHFHRSLGAGGIESMVCNLANAMAETEDVTVGTVFHQNQENLAYSKLDDKVHYISLNKKSDATKPFREILLMPFLIGRGHYDVVNIHGYFYYYVLAVLFLHKKTRFFYTLHSVAQHEGPPWDQKIQRIKTLYFKKGWMRAITISEMASQSFTEMYGLESRLIENGVPTPVLGSSLGLGQEFGLKADTRVFIHPARITAPKNQLVLCRVFDRLIKEGNDIALLIAGENHDRSIFEEISHYFSDRVRYIGIRKDIAELMSMSAGLCLPSLFEGFSLVLAEGLAVGCVPICTNVGLVPEAIEDGVSGIVSNSPSEEDYYDAMTRFLSLSDEQLSDMKAKCRQAFTRYEIHNASREYLEYYKSQGK